MKVSVRPLKAPLWRIYIVYEIVQSAKGFLLCVYKMQVVNCYQVLQVVVRKVEIFMEAL